MLLLGFKRRINHQTWLRRLSSSSSSSSNNSPTDPIPDDLSHALMPVQDTATGKTLRRDARQLQWSADGVLGDYLKGILRAQTVVYDVCKETDFQYAPLLSSRLGNHVYLKREDQQPVFSFKIRGAFNKIASLSQEARKKGIVTCSAGNHAQGVAFSASRLKIDNIIVMPLATPKIKVNAVRKFGGNVLLHGNNFDEAQLEAYRLRDTEGRTLIHPFDDPEVISGQGTVGMEILKQAGQKEIDSIFACVGGGGLLAGVAAYVKNVTPNTRMIGVEAKDAAAMTLSLLKNELVSLNQVGLFADGAAVKRPGVNTFQLIKSLADGMVTVNTDEICAAIKSGFEDTRSVFEPAGVLALAGLIKYVEATGIKDKTLVAITSGANLDFDRLRFISERADSSETLMAITIPERPGAFYELYMSILPRTVTEFSYRLSSHKEAHVFVSIQTKGVEDRGVLQNTLKSKGYGVLSLNEDELTKVHLRHMCGGRAPQHQVQERIFRFEFPERPGAFKAFLEGLFSSGAKQPWNVSLFHYRNHGADIGRVLAGLQIPKSENAQFDEFLKQLDFRWVEETKNPAYERFLR